MSHTPHTLSWLNFNEVFIHTYTHTDGQSHRGKRLTIFLHFRNRSGFGLSWLNNNKVLIHTHTHTLTHTHTPHHAHHTPSAPYTPYKHTHHTVHTMSTTHTIHIIPFIPHTTRTLHYTTLAAALFAFRHFLRLTPRAHLRCGYALMCTRALMTHTTPFQPNILEPTKHIIKSANSQAKQRTFSLL